MLRFGVYLVGLMIVVAAIWALLVLSGVTSFVPATIIAVVVLLLLGLGVMRAAGHVDEGPREIHEERQRVGDTEIRKSKLE